MRSLWFSGYPTQQEAYVPMYKSQLVHQSLIDVQVWVETLLKQTNVECDDLVHVMTRLCCVHFVAYRRAITYFVNVMRQVSYIGIVGNAAL